MRYRLHNEYLTEISAERLLRAKEIADTIRETLGDFVVLQKAEELELRRVTADQLKRLLLANPSLLKPLIAACNMGKRALRKDLGIEVDTYHPRLNDEVAQQVAEYLLPSLPDRILIRELVALDAYQWVDSAIRKQKGRWERQFGTLLRSRGVDCKKRKFSLDAQEYEVDLAYPSTGTIHLAVDMKMIGHPSDKHKRTDEIVNKATKFAQHNPAGRFLALVYYPFDDDRAALDDRLRTGSVHIADVVFAGDDDQSIHSAVDTLYAHYEQLRASGPATDLFSTPKGPPIDRPD